jgi:chemotaxis protein methyltransferase CheR
LTALELERFRAWVVRSLGLHFDDAKSAFLAEVLRRRMDATKEDAHTYLRHLDPEASPAEFAALAQELTVAETYFFRHVEQYRAFAEVALPDRLRSNGLGSRLSVVSAGCASGEEPYSLAITVRDVLGDREGAVSILGVDINQILIDKARRGRFSSWVLRDTPADVQRRWFSTEGREFRLDDPVQRAVRFDVCNLVDDRSELWRPQSHDVVFCRNVLMYFTPSSAQAVVGRLSRSLRPGGYLFLGHAETLRGLSTDFHLRHTHGTFYYQKKDSADAGDARPALPTQQVTQAEEPTTLANVVDGAPTWLEVIHQASERIRSLAESPRRGVSSARRAGSARVRPAREIGVALELLREERFVDALAIIAAVPAEVERDVEVLLLRAVLLTHGGQLVEAERECERLLAINELHAEAHYLLALCREGTGDQAGSIYHDQVAVYLDPSFAMAHLHLGLLARRTLDVSTARRELEQAIALLEREDASRLLLFGGGFSRDALVSLCRAELFRSGGSA